MLLIRYAIMLRFRVHLALVLLGTAFGTLGAERLIPGSGGVAFFLLAALGITHLARHFRLPRRVMALHEASHAVIAWHNAHHPAPTRALISRRGGMVAFEDDEPHFLSDENAVPLPVLQAHILVLLAGIVAEEHVGRMPCIGGFADLAKSIHYARLHARRSRSFPAERFLGSCLQRTRDLVVEHWATIDRLAAHLEARDDLDAEDLAAILGPRPPKD